jgi:hypothetical protein
LSTQKYPSKNRNKKQTIIVNIDNSRKSVIKRSKQLQEAKPPVPTIVKQPIYIPQYNYPLPQPLPPVSINLQPTLQEKDKNYYLLQMFLFKIKRL